MNALLAALQADTWAMHPDKLALLAQIVMLKSKDQSFDDARVQAATLVRLDGSIERETVEQGFARRGSVAVVGVSGVLSKYASQVDRSSGGRGTAYEEIIDGLTAARATAGIDKALLHIDSPGGAVSGCDEAYRAIRDMVADGFHIESFVSDLCASGAFYLAAATKRISASHSSEVGSIGVYTVVPDFSKFYNDQGVIVHLVTTGKVKGAGAHGTPITDAQLESLQRRVERAYGFFGDAVVAGRPKMTNETIKKLQGDTTSGDELVSLGLVDDLASLGSVLERMNGGEIGGVAARIGVSAMEQGTTTPDLAGESVDAGNATDVASGAAAGSMGAQPVQTFTDNQLEQRAESAMARVAAKRAGQVTQRRAEIAAICQPFAHVEAVGALLKAATENDDKVLETSVADLSAKVVTAAAEATKPTVSAGMVVTAGGFDGSVERRQDLEAVLTMRANRGLEDILLAGGDQAKEFAKFAGVDDPSMLAKRASNGRQNGLGRMRMIDIAQDCVSRAHIERYGTPPTFATDQDVFTMAASLGVSDFDGLMSNVANKSIIAAYVETPSRWPEFCAKTTVNDFKERNIVALSEAPNLLELPPGGRPERGDVNDQTGTDKLKTYARSFGLGREVIIDDDLQGFSRTPRLWGAAARRKPDDLVFALINGNAVYTGDNVATYNAAHNNLDTGAALSVRTLQSMDALMLKQKGFGPDEAYIEIELAVLVVPVALKHLAEQIRTSEYDPQSLNPGVTNAAGQAGGVLPNTMRNRCKVVASPRLDATSTTAFYGFGDPGRNPAIEVAFLNGNELPIISPISDGSILERRWEIIHDCSAAIVDPRATAKNAGA